MLEEEQENAGEVVRVHIGEAQLVRDGVEEEITPWVGCQIHFNPNSE